MSQEALPTADTIAFDKAVGPHMGQLTIKTGLIRGVYLALIRGLYMGHPWAARIQIGPMLIKRIGHGVEPSVMGPMLMRDFDAACRCAEGNACAWRAS